MSAWGLALASLWDRRLSTALHVVLFALGVMAAAALVLFTTALSENLSKSARGIDLVVGAKGSPLQLILSSIFQVDVPTGNITAGDAARIAADPLVKRAIPLALGDSFRGARVVGSTRDYVDHFGGELAEGRMFAAPYEAVIGAQAQQRIGIAVGDRFQSAHGLGDGGTAHAGHETVVVGRLKPTRTVLDRVIVTPVETVQMMHAIHPADAAASASGAAPTTPAKEAPAQHDHAGGNDMGHAHSALGEDAYPDEVTALLIQYRTPMAAVRLPARINRNTAMMAASPALETTRLLDLLGVGFDLISAFAWLLVAAAAVSVFVAMLQVARERRGDVALMRVMGASRTRVLSQSLLEGLIVAAIGAALGVAAAYGLMASLGGISDQAHAFAAGALVWRWEIGWILTGALTAGVAAALAPGLLAYRADLADTLAKA